MKERVKPYASIRDKAIAAHGKDPYQDFVKQKHGASNRGVEWNLSFPQWWFLWEEHYGSRGVKGHQLVMCRTGDVGAYEIGNVKIATARTNAFERGDSLRRRETEKAWDGNDGASDWLDDRRDMGFFQEIDSDHLTDY